MKPYVVNTRYVTAGGMVMVNSYGPYTQSVARRRRKNILAQAQQQGVADRVVVHACELRDPTGESAFSLEARQ